MIMRTTGEFSKRSFVVLCSLVIALPSAALAFFVREFGTTVIVADEWSMVPLFAKMMNGSLSFSDLFAQHNEHRIFFPRLAMLALDRITSFDTVAEMYLSWALITATTAIVFYKFWASCGRRRDPQLALLFLPISLTMLSFRQEEAILWGFTCQIYFMIIGVIAALYLLEYDQDRFIFLSIMSGLIASYSFFIGLAVWPIGLLMITLGNENKVRMIRRAVIWGIAGSLIAALYLYQLVFAVNNAYSDSPARILTFTAAILGAPFVFEPAYVSEAIGGFTVLIATLVVLHARTSGILKMNRMWFCLMIFAMIFAVVTAIGRSGLGVSEAMSSRYTPITILGITGLYFLAESAKRNYKGRGSNYCFHAVLTLLLLGLIISTGAGWHVGQVTKAQRDKAALILTTYKTQSDESIATSLNANSSLVRQWAGFLERNRLNVFHSSNNVSSTPPNLSEVSLANSANASYALLPSPNLRLHFPCYDSLYVIDRFWSLFTHPS